MNLSIGLLECACCEWLHLVNIIKDRANKEALSSYNPVPGAYSTLASIEYSVIINESLKQYMGVKGKITLHLFEAGLSSYVWTYFETSSSLQANLEYENGNFENKLLQKRQYK